MFPTVYTQMISIRLRALSPFTTCLISFRPAYAFAFFLANLQSSSFIMRWFSYLSLQLGQWGPTALNSLYSAYVGLHIRPPPNVRYDVRDAFISVKVILPAYNVILIALRT